MLIKALCRKCLNNYESHFASVLKKPKTVYQTVSGIKVNELYCSRGA